MSTADFEKYVELMWKSLDTSIDPTVDFIKYARGNFCKEDFDKTQGDYLPIVSGDCYDDVLLNETITYPSLVKARNFYKSYRKEFPILLKSKYLSDLCGTFPAFDHKWQNINFDWVIASAILSSMHFRITILCRCDFVDGQRKITMSVIGPDEFRVSDKSQVLRVMGVSEDQISTIVSDFDAIESKFNSFTPNSGYPNFERLRKTYAELKQEKFNYCKYIEFYLGDTLKEDDVFIINNLEPEYFDKFTNMFEEAGPRAMANYITFAVASQMENIFYSPIMVKNYFAPVIIAAGFSTFWNEEIGARRKEIFNYIKNSFENEKELFRTDYSSTVEELSEITDEEVMEFIGANFNQEQIEKEYKDMEIDPDDFFKNFVYLRNRGHTSSSSKTNNMDIYSGIFAKALQLLDFSVHHYNRPMSFYFSGWVLRFWYNYNIHKCNLEEKCEDMMFFEKYVKRQMEDRKFAEANSSKHFCVKHYTAMKRALRLSYKDFCRWMELNEDRVKMEEEILLKFDLNCRKSFFVSFVQHGCWMSDFIPYNYETFLALTNSQEFSDVYD